MNKHNKAFVRINMQVLHICILGLAMSMLCMHGYADSIPDTLYDGDLNQQLDDYLSSAKVFEQKHDTLSCYTAYRSIAWVYHDLKRDDKQLEYLLKSLNLAEKKKDAIMCSDIYSDLGAFHMDKGNKGQAQQYYEKLYTVSRQINDPYYLSHVYERLAKYYRFMGDKTLAFHYQQEALASMKKAGIPANIAFMHNALSELYQAENLSDSSIFHANQAYTIAAKSGNSKTQAIASMRLSKYHQQNRDIRKAIEYAEVAYRKAIEAHYPELARDAASQLGNLYETIGHYKESNTYVRNYRLLSDSLQRVENNRQITNLSSQIEYEKREAALKARIDLQQQRLRHQKWIGVLMSCILVLTGILAYTGRKSATARKRINILLNEQKEELSTANEELLTVNDELNRTYKELERHREHLEEIVKDKTSKLQEALQQAQESDRFKAAFFANMSHEIRTPLNAVLGFLQFIDDPSIDTGRRQEMIGLINANATQLLQMVDDIVTLSRIDSGLLTIQPEPFHMDQLLGEVMVEAHKLVKYAGKDRLELISENRLSASLQYIQIDGRRIEQVLLHLISNAVKFTQNGFVLIGCEADEAQGMLRFFVEDTGIGISAEHIKLIFQRFWKQGELYTQSYRGIGIGLSLCDELVRLMGGAFSVESMPDKGSVFRFTIRYEKA